MDYTPNINTQGMRQPMGPVDQPNWNGGPRLNHNPQVMNNRAVGQPNLSNAMANQQPIIPIRGRIVTSEQDIVPAEIPMDLTDTTRIAMPLVVDTLRLVTDLDMDICRI